MKIRNLGPAGKTGSFAVLHLAIAIAVGYLLTGSFVLAGLITLIEPALNTAAHAVFDGWWTRRHGAAPALRKTAAFALIHFAIAVAVVWALTGSLAIAGLLAVVEPLANAVALHFFDRWWSRTPLLSSHAVDPVQA
ncbi:MAG TPA: DUF2061 domain-containing protein [Rubrivivax sp.]|nr:DUF2061 domain-containing protein [Rubrivivax sp.]